ncbi:hypothetical protein SAMN02745207_04108 [Clostridium grantii DSM 8605]|uniref:Uncharacterized protein n=1 Tax=Clostridium grantii DSM 8605 TaxID=1121316 RepID=A0A1M5Y167_9CLOT|nr:hypothetical protein SAMN02745207_04108 [Clostridium grantii DSM 8605]
MLKIIYLGTLGKGLDLYRIYIKDYHCKQNKSFTLFIICFAICRVLIKVTAAIDNVITFTNMTFGMNIFEVFKIYLRLIKNKTRTLTVACKSSCFWYKRYMLLINIKKC